MDVRELSAQLTPADRLPGVALLVARDVVEYAVADGVLIESAAEDLRRAVDHLALVSVGGAILQSHPALLGELLDIAQTRSLPPKADMSRIRDVLRQLVKAVPAEGSVPVSAGYAGF
ncbi:hypothetical protein GCM10027598_04740 [Amycolatopsis oliviviridis]|uniref:Uncharacterized protein n=1 Tax=Amycolatopsis oliviviridis TaxID=1471590 RepID=A0ABQ3LVM3_9PSEU|nr:hypothetical protein [Amycolatopsis oliviviridis]GHH19464.1 hypothetical protein GCM10017790_38130 [Amycolatopsis oliviviridis]